MRRSRANACGARRCVSDPAVAHSRAAASHPNANLAARRRHLRQRQRLATNLASHDPPRLAAMSPSPSSQAAQLHVGSASISCAAIRPASSSRARIHGADDVRAGGADAATHVRPAAVESDPDALGHDFRRWSREALPKCDVLGIANDGFTAELIEVTTEQCGVGDRADPLELAIPRTVNRVHNLTVDWQLSPWKPGPNPAVRAAECAGGGHHLPKHATFRSAPVPGVVL